MHNGQPLTNRPQMLTKISLLNSKPPSDYNQSMLNQLQMSANTFYGQIFMKSLYLLL
jgi:hypothetical protein